MRRSMRILVALGLAACVAGFPQTSRADDYPNRSITLIVPFPPGGSTTVMARNVADKMSAALGQSIVVENRGGAGGTLATRFAAKAAPDGYTILLSYTGTFSIAPTAYADRGCAQSAGGDPVTAGEFARGADRLRQGADLADAVWLTRRRHRQSSGRRN